MEMEMEMEMEMWIRMQLRIRDGPMGRSGRRAIQNTAAAAVRCGGGAAST